MSAKYEFGGTVKFHDRALEFAKSITGKSDDQDAMEAFVLACFEHFIIPERMIEIIPDIPVDLEGLDPGGY